MAGSSSKAATLLARSLRPSPRLLPCTCSCATPVASPQYRRASTSTSSNRKHAASTPVSIPSSSTPRTRRSYATVTSDLPKTDEGPVEQHDIVIVGGGLVGLAFANALSASRIVEQAGYRVSLLEASDLDKVANWSLPPGKWSNRISSITEESQAFLSRSGGWQKVDFARTRPCEEMQVWDGLSGSRIEFSAWDVHPEATAADQPEMAKFVENTNLQKALLLNLREQAKVECIDKTKVAQIVRGDTKEHGGWPIVHLDNGRRIRARLLVGADGFNSPVKNYSEIKTTGWAYDAHCLVGTLELQPNPMDTNMTAWQRFLPVGPLGFLPVSSAWLVNSSSTGSLTC